ncbi:MAG: glycosyltransferase [Phycisphaerales bacterium]
MPHILLLSRNQGYATPDGQQIMPFFMYREELKAKGITFTNVPTTSQEDRTNAIRSAFKSTSRPDVVLVMPHWSEKADELAEWFDHTRNEITPSRLMMLDYYAPTSSPHFSVLPYVDRYIKRQTLRDRSLYQHDFQGGFIYADFVSRTWGFDLKDWHFGSKPDPAQLHKLVAGWNLGITPRYRKILGLSKLNPIPWSMRPIDVQMRVGTINRTDKPQEWYQFSRNKALEQVQTLKDMRLLSGSGRVSSRKYFAELSLSKVVVSPFGWGEVCFRDYEAVVSGALLVKPDMSHLQTEPNIYVADETYLPIAWDYSDAPEAIDACLREPARCKRMIKNARAAWHDYDNHQGFLSTCKSIFST